MQPRRPIFRCISQKTILSGNLPAGAKIKLITHEDFETALRQGVASEHMFYELMFIDGYDAAIEHGARNCRILDIVVSLDLLDRFTPESGN